MAEAAEKRIQDALNDFVHEIDANHLRDIQREMHLCAARCCENKAMSMESVDRCVKDCSKRGQAAQDYIQEELKTFQERINRCALDCRDQLRDAMDSLSKKNGNQLSGDLQQKADKCLMKCADDHIRLIPGLKSRVADFLVKNR